MAALRPGPGFNPLQVGWGGPDEPRATKCRYCDKPFAKRHVPLLVCRPDGWVAAFCDQCVRRYFELSR